MPILNWIGKDAVINHDKDVPFRLLKKNKSKSKGNSENLIVEGDNLEALKALLPYYQNKIKCIYIDPPYNTGNEKWIYNDNVNSPKIKKWLGKVVGNENEDLARHDKWLCMVYPRLKLLKKLLRDDGIIFVSIDDNEYDHLLLVMKEIFGEENFINSISIKMSESTGVKMTHADKRLPKLKEHILFFRKSSENQLKITPPVIPKEKWDTEYKYLINGISKTEIKKLKTIMNDEVTTTQDIDNADEICSRISLSSIDDLHQKIHKETEEEVNAEIEKINIENAWRIVRDVATTESAKKLANKKRKESNLDFFLIVTPKNKKYLMKRDYNEKSSQPRSRLLFADDYLTSNVGDFWHDIKTTGLDNEGNVEFKNGKKPLKLIKRILEIINDRECIILDSFAGSGTTGEAVLQQNKEDGGKRKFILVELESDICRNKTAKRIQNTITDYENEKGIEDGFQYAILDKKLFNSDGRINETCTFDELASYIFFTETKTILDTKKINKTLIDTFNDTEFHLIFDGIGRNKLDRKFLINLDRQNTKIIYADKCTVDDSVLKKYNTIFKQIPYEVREF